MKSARAISLGLFCIFAVMAWSGCGTGTASPAPPAVALPTVTVTPSGTTVANGAGITLTVTATNATSVVISNNVNSTTYTLSPSGGAQIVSPTQTTTYTVTASGAGGTATATTTITVSTSLVAPTVTITASPTSLAGGGSSTLTVTATNATSVVISDNLDSTTYTLPVAGGTQAVSLSQTTTYTATATGVGGITTAAATVTVTPVPPTVTITANPTTVNSGGSSTLTVTATNASTVVISDNVDTNTYSLAATGGTQAVTITKNTIYTATATGPGGTVTATATVKIIGTVNSVNHVLFLMQENRTFDTYFGMLNPYRAKNAMNVADDGNTYNVDGIDDKLSTTNSTDSGNLMIPVESFPLFHTTSSCLDDMTSSWLESYGDVSRFDFSVTRKMNMDGFVHTAENYAQDGAAGNATGEGTFTDFAGQRAMAYYEDTSSSGAPQLNYYYYMASQFALSDRWFSPISSKSTPNRIATMTGGTTQGLVFDPFVDDKLTTTLTAPTIFQELDSSSPAVTWKIYYTLTTGGCDTTDGDCGNKNVSSFLPVTTFLDFGYSGKYIYGNASQAPCVAPTIGSKQAVGDPSNAFCIDPSHIAPLSQLFTDMTNGTLPQFSYIEAGYGVNDEHPGSGQSIFAGQAQVALILSKLMNSPSWADSVFFLSYDEGGGPYEHVPPVPGHSNDKTNIANMGFLPGGSIPDIQTIAVNPDAFAPCLSNGPPTTTGGNPTPTVHCDLNPANPGTSPSDAVTAQGFAAQLGFRLPNMVISPFTRKHYVSHVPMDHTAIIKFVENRFIGPTAHLTNRDAAQPDLLDFFDFTNIPWQTPPPAASIPVPPAVGGTCTPTTMGP